MSFVKKGVVIPLGATGEFDDTYALTPAVLERDGKVYLYYAGYDGANYRVGLAISEDGVNFTKKGVVLPLGAAGEFDDVLVACPAVLERDGKVLLYYDGSDGANDRVGLAISKDGF